MDQTKTPAVGAARGEANYLSEPRQFIKKQRPAYAQQFRADENGFAVLCIGWPPTRPPASNVVAFPPDTAPAAINWCCLKGCHVFAMPTPGATAPHELLRELGAELAAAGIASLTIFDGTEVLGEFWRSSAERPGVLA